MKNVRSDRKRTQRPGEALMVEINRHQRVGLVATAALILSALIAPVGAQAYTTSGCRWASSTIGLQAVTLPSGYTNYSTSAGKWNPTDATFVNVSSGAYTAEVQNNGANGTDGITVTSCTNGSIYKARSWLNTNSAQAGSLSTAGRQAVWVHEFGHGLGLGHSSAGTIMFTCPRCTFNNYSGRNTPQADDINGANFIY